MGKPLMRGKHKYEKRARKKDNKKPAGNHTNRFNPQLNNHKN